VTDQQKETAAAVRVVLAQFDFDLVVLISMVDQGDKLSVDCKLDGMLAPRYAPEVGNALRRIADEIDADMQRQTERHFQLRGAS
jgi:hypothetical protein